MMTALSELWGALLPPLLTLVATGLSWLIAGAATAAKTRWGIEIEARHREALHSALMSGIRAALMRGLTGEAAIAAAVAHAAASVPDALASLDPAATVLRSIAEAKLRDAQPLVGLDFAGGAPR